MPKLFINLCLMCFGFMCSSPCCARVQHVMVAGGCEVKKEIFKVIVACARNWFTLKLHLKNRQVLVVSFNLHVPDMVV